MGVVSPIDVTPEQHEMILTLLHRHLPGITVWVYGSRAKWTSRPQSDLDLVVFAKPKQAYQVGNLREALEESDLPFRVDLFVWDEVPESFRDEIVESHVLFFTEKISIQENWQEIPFSQAIQINPKVELNQGQNYPYVDMVAVNPNSKFAYADTEREFKGGGSRFHDGDTLMARITPCLENGKIARYHASQRVLLAHGSTEFIVIRGRPNVTDNNFSYYLTQWDLIREYAVGQMTGTSGRQRVPTESFNHINIPLPPIPEQRAIAHILGTLDDKIEGNRRMNETLEAMARAIFRDWFVEFGPVRAKVEGRAPYLAPELWERFPDRLDDEDKPVGWRVGTVGDCFRLTMGQSPPGRTYNENGEGLPFFQGRTDFGFRYPKNRKYCTVPTRIAERDDTLVSVRAPVGDINMAWDKCCIGRGVAVLRHVSGSRSFTYYSAWAVQQKLKQYEHTGTVFGAINKKQFEALSILEPAQEFVALFENQAAPLDEHIRKNIFESRTLARTRDLLLPKLMSGEIRLRDAGKMVEAVA